MFVLFLPLRLIPAVDIVGAVAPAGTSRNSIIAIALAHATTYLGSKVHGREKIGDKPKKNGRVCAHDLRRVEISQRTHQDSFFINVGIAALQLASYQQDRLDRSETPIIVELVGRFKNDEVGLRDAKEYSRQ